MKNTQCRNCQQFGHLQKFCKNPVAARQVYIVDATENKEEQLFMAMVEQECNLTEVRTSTWLIDSGCTNHMSADLSIFKNLDRNYVSKVRVANGEYVPSETLRLKLWQELEF